MIAVLDYGIGNLRSAEKALTHVGGEARLVSSPEEAAHADGVVLPGVGAFGACADALQGSGLDVIVRLAVAERVPLLAICVGFQLLFEGSEESPGSPGLGIFPGVVEKMVTREKLPQMQWNTVAFDRGSSSMFPHATSDEAQWFYFVHSYAVPAERAVDGETVYTCDYGGPVVAAIERENCWGVQFHPEKSGVDGLALLSRFVECCVLERRALSA